MINCIPFLSIYICEKFPATEFISPISTKLTILEDEELEVKMKKNAPWLSVPQFGDWDQKGQVPDYSMDFSKIRENRKQNKRDVSRASLGNEEELIAGSTNTSGSNPPSYQQDPDHHYHQNQHSPTTRRSFLSYFNCCVKA